jgi:hypothetical protein
MKLSKEGRRGVLRNMYNEKSLFFYSPYIFGRWGKRRAGDVSVMRQYKYEIPTGTHSATVNVTASGHGNVLRRRMATILLLNIRQVFAIQNPVIFCYSRCFV